jgi:hypothetical protein
VLKDLPKAQFARESATDVAAPSLDITGQRGPPATLGDFLKAGGKPFGVYADGTKWRLPFVADDGTVVVETIEEWRALMVAWQGRPRCRR